MWSVKITDSQDPSVAPTSICSQENIIEDNAETHEMIKHMSHVLVLIHIYTISAHSPEREGLAEPDVAEVVFCSFSKRDMY